MPNVGLIIAGGVLVIYLILGPIVLLAFNVFLDRMAEKTTEDKSRKKSSFYDKDPALWTAGDVRQ